VRARVHSTGRRGVILALPGGETEKASVSGLVYRDAGGAVCGDLVEAVPGCQVEVTDVCPGRRSSLYDVPPESPGSGGNVDRVLLVVSVCRPALKGLSGRVLAPANTTG
jgi:hypothetical protein